MNQIIYKVQFFDFWHTGSGLSGSTYADNIVHKNEDNLPIIAGKTIKGLFREAAESIHKLNSGLITADFIAAVFGSADVEPDSFFSNVTLSKTLSEGIVKGNNQNALYQVIASTEIDGDGQAKDGSLRMLEVTIPLSLYGAIENVSPLYHQQMIHCFNWVKELGVNRNRGLGRCHISIV